MACSWKHDRAIEKERGQNMDRKRQSSTERAAKVSIKEARSLWTMAAWFNPPSRSTPNDSPPLQWQIRQIRDDPWKPIGVLTAGERPWPRSAGCITVGKRSCQGQTGSQLCAMPPPWRHTARAWAHPPPLYFIYCIPALKHSQADLLHQFFWSIYHLTGVEIIISRAISWHIDNL